MSLMDAFMPRRNFSEVHSVMVRATPATIFKVIKEITPLEIPLLYALSVLLPLPKRFLEKTVGLLTGSRPILEQALKAGFFQLAETPDEELLLGWIGQFWKLRGGSSPMIGNANQFIAFDTPGYAKATIDFLVAPIGDATRLSTETRISATDPESLKKFARYWRVIHPGSALVRRVWLNAIKQSAERNA
jgi:hypothetical protein